MEKIIFLWSGTKNWGGTSPSCPLVPTPLIRYTHKLGFSHTHSFLCIVELVPQIPDTHCWSEFFYQLPMYVDLLWPSHHTASTKSMHIQSTIKNIRSSSSQPLKKISALYYFTPLGYGNQLTKQTSNYAS